MFKTQVFTFHSLFWRAEARRKLSGKTTPTDSFGLFQIAAAGLELNRKSTADGTLQTKRPDTKGAEPKQVCPSKRVKNAGVEARKNQKEAAKKVGGGVGGEKLRPMVHFGTNRCRQKRIPVLHSPGSKGAGTRYK